VLRKGTKRKKSGPSPANGKFKLLPGPGFVSRSAPVQPGREKSSKMSGLYPERLWDHPCGGCPISRPALKLKRSGHPRRFPQQPGAGHFTIVESVGVQRRNLNSSRTGPSEAGRGIRRAGILNRRNGCRDQPVAPHVLCDPDALAPARWRGCAARAFNAARCSLLRRLASGGLERRSAIAESLWWPSMAWWDFAPGRSWRAC